MGMEIIPKNNSWNIVYIYHNIEWEAKKKELNL